VLNELVDDRYKVEQEVGRGGMGVVLRAYDTRLNRAVALKMLPSNTTHDSELCRRLAAEARAASALSHPCIATVYDFVEQGERSFIVYEFVEGRTWRNELARARFTTDEILDASAQLADALAAAHSHGIVHRDLKPENIMSVSDDYSRGRAKLLKIGLAKHLHAALPLGEENAAETVAMATSAGLLVGTVNYMAPEQLEGQSVDARPDIYALGLVLYEMATGANPFLGRTPSSTIANILKQEAPSLRLHIPTAPAELDRVLQKCLRKRPEERYQSARELLADLRNLRRVPAMSPGPSQAPEIESSLLQRFSFLFFFGAESPYRRWEVLHLGMILWWFVLPGYLGSRFWAVTAYKWGWILFFLEMACILLLSILGIFLVYTGIFDRSSLPREIRRTAPWTLCSTVALILVMWTMVAIVVVAHPVLASLLAIFGTAGSIEYLLFKRSLDRALLDDLDRG